MYSLHNKVPDPDDAQVRVTSQFVLMDTFSLDHLKLNKKKTLYHGQEHSIVVQILSDHVCLRDMQSSCDLRL